MMAEQCCSTYWELFVFSPRVELEHQVKDVECFSLTASLVESTDGTKLLETSAGIKKKRRNFA